MGLAKRYDAAHCRDNITYSERDISAPPQHHWSWLFSNILLRQIDNVVYDAPNEIPKRNKGEYIKHNPLSVKQFSHLAFCPDCEAMFPIWPFVVGCLFSCTLARRIKVGEIVLRGSATENMCSMAKHFKVIGTPHHYPINIDKKSLVLKVDMTPPPVLTPKQKKTKAKLNLAKLKALQDNIQDNTKTHYVELCYCCPTREAKTGNY